MTTPTGTNSCLRGVVESGASLYPGKKLHGVDGGNYRGTIEIVEIHRHPDGVNDANRVVVKKVTQIA
jgi:hypothetical protein